MIDLTTCTINKQAKEEQQDIKFTNINTRIIMNDYKECGNAIDADFENDDKSYKTRDDSAVDGDNDLPDEPDQLEEDQEQHFNVLEVNDIGEGDSSSKNEGVGDQEVDKEDNPLKDNEKTVHNIEDEDGAGEEDKN